MANDENKIILEFPATNVEIEFGETITFDNISGFLNSDRVTYNDESLTEEIAHLEDDKADNTKLASEYDEEETYYRGDIVLYNGVLYECDNTDASGEFNPSDWKEITLGEGIEDVRDLLANYYTKSQIDLHFLGKTNPSGTGYFSLNRRGSAGAYSVSVGRLNEASAQSSFAEGENNASSGYASHSEGYGNAASGLMAHAEGVTTESSGYGSHSEGVGTIANHIGQHVIGTYNVADPSTADPTAKGNYIEIVGNGTDDNRRRNARTLDWSGNETLMGDLIYNGNKRLSSEISRLGGRIDTKANASDVYTKSQTDNLLNGKVDDIIYNILPDDTASGSVANFETDLALPLKSLKVDVNAVQSGSGDPSPDNVRPISGWSSVNVTRTGKNLLPSLSSAVTVNHITFSPLSDGAIDINGTASGNASVDVGRNEGCFLQAGTYYVNITATPYTITVFGMVNGTVMTIKSGGGLFTLTKPTQIFVRVLIASGTSVNHFRLPLQIEFGSTATDYEPYNGTTEVINLGNTYYGGHFTQDKDGHRQFEVTHSFAPFTGDENWTAYQSMPYHYQVDLPNVLKNNGSDKNSISNMFTSRAGMNSSSATITEGVFSADGNRIRFKKTSCADLTAWVNFVTTQYNNGKPLQVRYKLETPIIIDLPDGEPIITLNGTNNIYADTGDCAVEFKVSVEQYVSNHSGGSLGSSLRGGLLGSNPNTDESEDTGNE